MSTRQRLGGGWQSGAGREAGTDSPPQPLKEPALPTLLLGLWHPEMRELMSVVLSHPCGMLWYPSPGNSTHGALGKAGDHDAIQRCREVRRGQDGGSPHAHRSSRRQHHKV